MPVTPVVTASSDEFAMTVLLDLAAGRAPVRHNLQSEALVALAVDHHMEGVLWAAVKNGLLDLDEAGQRQLALQQLRHRARHNKLWADLAFIAANLAALGVEIGTFKGITFESMWYGHLGERPSLDLDLFISPYDRGRLGEVVESIAPELAHRAEMSALATAGFLETLDIRLSSGTWVDLHLDMLKWALPPRDARQMWDLCLRLQLDNGSVVRVPDATLALIVALVNVNRDRFRTVRGLADIARILDRGNVDWSIFKEVVEHEGYTVHCYKTLEVACGLLRIPTPIDTEVHGLRGWLWDRVWNPKVRLPGTSRIFDKAVKRYYWGPFLVRGRLRDAIRWWLRRALPPPSVIRYWYPDIAGPAGWRLIVGRYRSRSRGR